MPDVLYTPQHPQDPAITEWHGRKFEAGKPVTVDKGHPMLKSIDGNPWFSVDGKAKSISGRKGDPSTPEEYRAYALGWVNTSVSSAKMAARWDSERPLREAVGWGPEDDDLIQPIYQPKLENLQRAEQYAA